MTIPCQLKQCNRQTISKYIKDRKVKSCINAKERLFQKLACLRVWLFHVFIYLFWKSNLFSAKLHNHLYFSWKMASQYVLLERLWSILCPFKSLVWLEQVIYQNIRFYPCKGKRLKYQHFSSQNQSTSQVSISHPFPHPGEDIVCRILAHLNYFTFWKQNKG